MNGAPTTEAPQFASFGLRMIVGFPLTCGPAPTTGRGVMQVCGAGCRIQQGSRER